MSAQVFIGAVGYMFWPVNRSKHAAYYSNKYLLCWRTCMLVCSLYTSLEPFVMPSLKKKKQWNLLGGKELTKWSVQEGPNTGGVMDESG